MNDYWRLSKKLLEMISSQHPLNRKFGCCRRFQAVNKTNLAAVMAHMICSWAEIILHRFRYESEWFLSGLFANCIKLHQFCPSPLVLPILEVLLHYHTGCDQRMLSNCKNMDLQYDKNDNIIAFNNHLFLWFLWAYIFHPRRIPSPLIEVNCWLPLGHVAFMLGSSLLPWASVWSSIALPWFRFSFQLSWPSVRVTNFRFHYTRRLRWPKNGRKIDGNSEKSCATAVGNDRWKKQWIDRSRWSIM